MPNTVPFLLIFSAGGYLLYRTMKYIGEKFQKEMVTDRLEQRYINLTDQVYQYKALIKKNPNDVELKEDYVKLEQERQEVKKKLENK